MKRANKVKAEARALMPNGIIDAARLPIWTLPRTTEAYDAIVEQMARAAYNADEDKVYFCDWDDYGFKSEFIGTIRAAIRAIGIVRPKELRK